MKSFKMAQAVIKPSGADNSFSQQRISFQTPLFKSKTSKKVLREPTRSKLRKKTTLSSESHFREPRAVLLVKAG